MAAKAPVAIHHLPNHSNDMVSHITVLSWCNHGLVLFLEASMEMSQVSCQPPRNQVEGLKGASAFFQLSIAALWLTCILLVCTAIT